MQLNNHMKSRAAVEGNKLQLSDKIRNLYINKHGSWAVSSPAPLFKQSCIQNPNSNLDWSSLQFSFYNTAQKLPTSDSMSFTNNYANYHPTMRCYITTVIELISLNKLRTDVSNIWLLRINRITNSSFLSFVSLGYCTFLCSIPIHSW